MSLIDPSLFALLAVWTAVQSTPPEPLAPLPPGQRLVPVPATHVKLREEAFFTPWFRRNLETTLFVGHEQLEKHGQFENFRLAAGALRDAPAQADDYHGVHFYDSDAYKWLEAASLALAYGPNPRLEALIDRFIAEIAAAQEPDGYVQTQYTFAAKHGVPQKGDTAGDAKDDRKFERWIRLPDDHELYCAGHLIQAGIAHHEVTGKTTLYDVALRFADCIDQTFGPGKCQGCCGHPEIETALVQLWRHSQAGPRGPGGGDKRWLELAKFFLDERGQKPPRAGGDFYRQDERPIREQRTAAGHAVRQLYLLSGMAGVAAETDDRALFDAALAISRDIDECKLYVTGGVGARHDGEAFGEPFELPNESAYAETCASIALMRFSNEMLALTGSASFADRVENTLYNAFLASTGADGKSFFYVNPLESQGGKQRQDWFWCACCPPNIMRTFAGLPGWFASTSRDALYLHQFDAIDVATKLGDGREVGVRLETGYPWPFPNGRRVAVTLTNAPAGEMTLALRRPKWAGDRVDAFVDEGESQPGAPGVTSDGCDFKLTQDPDGWLRVRGKFKAGHRVVLDLPVDVEKVTADPRVVECRGKVALRLGPVVFAFESVDQGQVRKSDDVIGALDPPADLFATALDPSAKIWITQRVHLPGYGTSPGWTEPHPTLATSGVETSAVGTRAVSLIAIPYFAWANRGDSKMRLWMPALANAPLAPSNEPSPSKEPGQAPPRPEATFAGDVKFLGERADVVVLQAKGCGPVAVSPKLTGRVMTSAFAENEPGFGLVVREEIARPPVERGFSNYGGEDRLWLAPEGGPSALFFDPGAKQELSAWRVPPSMDGRPRTVTAQDATSITFRDVLELKNVKGVPLHLSIERRVEALSREETAKLLGAELGERLKIAAFRSTNRVKNEAATPLPDDTLVAAWVLGQFKPTAQSVVLMPFEGRPDVIKRDYFGVVPKDRLQIFSTPDGAFARFKADGLLRSKIGVSAAGATGWLGAWDRTRGVLTLVHHTLPPEGASVPDCNWIDPNPRARSGDVATSYNHGEEPRFFEMESISSALPAYLGGEVTQVHATIHLSGDPTTLARIAKALLNADL